MGGRRRGLGMGLCLEEIEDRRVEKHFMKHFYTGWED
jgi:hypothetical protein